jgi:predicted Zn-dependent peptidase
MKILLYIIVATFVAGVCLAQEKREERPRFKGVELYSWKDSKGDWVFALVNGTNRQKTAEEVKALKNQIAGLGKLEKAFAHLAVDERVSWSNQVEGFEYPPQQTIKRIEKFAKESKITLRRADPNE